MSLTALGLPHTSTSPAGVFQFMSKYHQGCANNILKFEQG